MLHSITISAGETVKKRDRSFRARLIIVILSLTLQPVWYFANLYLMSDLKDKTLKDNSQ